MSNVTTLLPTSVALNSDAAIEAILSDIPLFCEGIMGIGVFTFLFFTKQVNLLSIFLYGSSFIAFAAATLDLGQVLARGPWDTSRGISLDTVIGFIYAREVLLSLAVGSLNLFFWRLVAQIPKEEIFNEDDNSLGNKGAKQLHSASWNYWGAIGIALKWGSLSALLSVPLLQILWRTMSGQRKYGCIYIAETIIQTSITFVFVLKLMLNVYSSTKAWWDAFRLQIIPIASLFVGAGLGVGNIIMFAFTETSLGRLLRAIQVYCLIVFGLYTTFQGFQTVRSSLPVEPPAAAIDREKFQGADLLPFAYSVSGNNPQYNGVSQIKVIQKPDSNSRVSNLSWIQSRRRSSLSIETLQRSNIRAPDSSNGIITVSLQEIDKQPPLLGMPRDLSQPAALPIKPRDSLNSATPLTPVSLSYYTTVEDGNKLESQYSQTLRGLKEQIGPGQETRFTEAIAISQQGSVSSMDEIFRQQNELDKSIAALRLFSMQDFSIESQPSLRELSTTATTKSFVQSRSTLNSTKTESISNRSDFSLSIFPEPPPIVKHAPATKYGLSDGDEGTASIVVPPMPIEGSHVHRQQIMPSNVPSSESIPPPSSPTQNDPTSFFNPPGTQDDETSAMEEYADAKNPPHAAIPSEEPSSVSSDDESATVASAVMLRPMILASTVLTLPPEQESDNTRKTAPPSSYAGEAGRSTPSRDSSSSQTLRPLLLGKPITSIPPTLPSATMVPLAQRRRQRGGTLTSTQRPMIGVPRLDSQMEALPGAFERPRTPPGVRARR